MAGNELVPYNNEDKGHTLKMAEFWATEWINPAVHAMQNF